MTFFTDQMIVVYFLYGLAFFTMSLVIAAQARQDSNFVLAKPIWFLSGFGLFQALAEWAKVAKLLHMYGINLLNIPLLHLIDVLTIGISFIFLLLFGVHLITDSLGKYTQLKFVPLLLAIVWTLKFIIIDFMILPVDDFRVWTAYSIAWARYLLGFPGAILVSIGLTLQLPALKRLELNSAYFNCKIAAIVFVAYGFFSGLITFPVDFWPGNVLNTSTFLQQTSLPVQFFRALLGLLMAYTIIRTINIFNVEQQKRLEEADKLSVLIEERDRFSRDLHDGIIQSVYGVGLSIDSIQAMLNKDKTEEASDHLNEVKKRLNNTIAELRNYIRDLQKDKDTEGSLEHMLSTLIQEFRGLSMMPIELADETEEEIYLNEKEEKHIYHIVQEALFNVVKHARASKVKITIEEEGKKVLIRLKDNGTGFNLPEVQKRGSLENKGLTNMKFRAQRLGGRLTVNTELGRGTELVLRFPKSQ